VLACLKRISRQGILGINNRNANYTLKYNDRSRYPIVDDKWQTKQLALQAGLPVPELYAVLEIERQIKDVHHLLDNYSEFVIKPACGSGGNGIMVISGRFRDLYKKVGGSLMQKNEFDFHASNILSGLYSLGGQTDKAIIEYRVNPDSVFESISYLGVPDIRIIVFFGVPVMSMVRLPTRISDGKANLHQGAIGAGINVAKGVTLEAVWKNLIVTEHPDTGNSVTGIEIPSWDRLLSIASQCYGLTGLVYQGVDLVLDREKGPMILEINARPGLNIQIANQRGLLPHLKAVEGHYHELDTVEDRIQFAKDNF
jgi:alpha-L-glutamate ligase-like protein